ncbi:PIR Superfamily Protein [Plasmodium ovale curtisi]|uniref:PIR Superfamily Protein n=1 Tax=Plasmodium ovale curtisi TaxID=864141 RepID=A0A1A8VK55_PLAOA|nr:PIR Superfamily Protein [Plasmodium ovale curtisi]
MEDPVHIYYLNNVHPLSSNKIYDMLDTVNITKGDIEKCRQLDSILERVFKDSMGVYFFCQSFTGNLQHYDNITFSNFFDKFRCNFLNIWIHEQLLKKNPNSDDRESLFIKGKITRFWGDYEFEKKCKYEFPLYSFKEYYDKMKRLYEYALNYEKLYFFIKTRNDPCTTEDDQYIKESVKFYQEVESECESESDIKRMHCDALRNIREFYSDYKLSELTCTRIMPAEDVLKEIQEKTERGLDDVVFKEITPADSHIDLPDSEVSHSEDVSSSSGSHNAMAVSFPFLGILFIFYSLYKFTPVGSLLNSRLLRNKINNFDINEDGTELLQNELDHEHINIQNAEHGIGYHPVQ